MTDSAAHARVPRIYLGIFVALLALTAITVLVSYVDLGALNTPIALFIAALKAALVILFFMHVKDSSPLVWLALLAGFFWLGILVVLTMGEVATRGLIPIPGK